MGKSRKTPSVAPSPAITMRGRNGGTLRRGNPGNGGGRPTNEFKERMHQLVCSEDVDAYLKRCLKGEFGPRFFLTALEFATERAYGRATAFVEQTINNPPPPVNPDELRAIFALVLGRGMTIPQAENYIRTHPEEVKAWLAKSAAQSAE